MDGNLAPHIHDKRVGGEYFEAKYSYKLRVVMLKEFPVIERICNIKFTSLQEIFLWDCAL